MLPHPPPECRNVADDICEWFSKLGSETELQQQNYTVGVTQGGKLIVSKAGGLTSKVRWTAELRNWVEERRSFWLCTVNGLLLAKRYTWDGAHNHGEMCVLAASRALGEQLILMACTGDNCRACSVTLSAFCVPSLNGCSPNPQIGWTHPCGLIAVGSAYNSEWCGQISRLEAYNEILRNTGELPSSFAFAPAMRLSSKPKTEAPDLVDDLLSGR